MNGAVVRVRSFLAVGVVGVSLAISSVVSGPTAKADVVPPHAAPAYEGTVRISTTPDGYADFQINGRGQGWSYDQHRPEYCTVRVGQLSTSVPIDAAGNGSGRLGPLDHGSYPVSGRCVDSYHMTGSELLLNTIDIVVDGQGAAVGSGGGTPKPEGAPRVASSLNDYCNGAADALLGVGAAGLLAGPAVGVVTTGAALVMSTALRSYCVSTAVQIGQSETAAEQSCKILEDAVFGWVEGRLGNFPLQNFLPVSCPEV